MTLDSHPNFAYSTVATAPSPATSGTSLVLAAGDGSKFVADCNAPVWPAGSAPLASNCEIVRITNVSTDTLTIVRQQEGTSARSILVGDQIMIAPTKKMFDDIDSAIAGAGASGWLARVETAWYPVPNTVLSPTGATGDFSSATDSEGLMFGSFFATDAPFDFDRLGIYVDTGNGDVDAKIRLGAYQALSASDASVATFEDLFPTLIVDGGTASIETDGSKFIDLGGTFTCDPPGMLVVGAMQDLDTGGTAPKFLLYSSVQRGGQPQLPIRSPADGPPLGPPYQGLGSICTPTGTVSGALPSSFPAGASYEQTSAGPVPVLLWVRAV